MLKERSGQVNVLLDGQVVQNNWYCAEENNPQMTGNEGIVFAFKYWFENREKCAAYKGPKGIACKNTDDVSQLKADIKNLNLICIEFPVAADGRAYSQAHLLRQRYGYTNELRAVGEIEIDQLFLMTRCGINAFTFSEDIDLIQASKYLTPFSISYQ